MKAYSGGNFTYNYTVPTSNVNRNFSVINTVVAPATATATNENQDNDVISNTATNAAAGKRKRRKRSKNKISFDTILNNFLTYSSTLFQLTYHKRNDSGEKQ